jgi:hypothetical protein
MSEPTSTLTFRDLVKEVAHKLGIGYYGSDGTEELQAPTDTHDLDECKRHVNNAIRMFINDAPRPNGWRWLSPVGSMVLFAPVAEKDGRTVSGGSYDSTEDETQVTSTEDIFHPSMEEKTLTLNNGNTYTLKRHVDAKNFYVDGDASGESSEKFSIDPDGSWTMPRDFSGQVTGEITYDSNTNQGVSLNWVNEAMIRAWREDITDETGDPFWVALRVMSTGRPRRRWELVAYPEPDEDFVILFPYTIHFDKLTDLAETPPFPFSHDETVRAACRAVVERDVENVPGPDYQYYSRQCLPNSHRIDAQSAPRALGYFGNPGARSAPGIHEFRARWYQRPDVSFNQ